MNLFIFQCIVHINAKNQYIYVNIKLAIGIPTWWRGPLPQFLGTTLSYLLRLLRWRNRTYFFLLVFVVCLCVCVFFFFYSCDDQFDEHWTCTKKKNRIFLVGKCTIDYVDDFIDNQIEYKNVNWCGATHTIANAQDVLYFVESQHKVLVEFSTLPYDDITIVLFFSVPPCLYSLTTSK